MIRTALVTLLLLVAVSTEAQTPPLPATYVTNRDVQTFLNALPKNAVSDKPVRVVDVGGYHIGVYGVLRPKDQVQQAAVHYTKVTEIYYILSGNATLVTGGTIQDLDSKEGKGAVHTAQGSRIDGGVAQKVGPGDTIVIPGRTPHWFSSQEGDLRYLIFRADPEGVISLK